MTGAPELLTQLELLSREQEAEHWIRFGYHVSEQIIDRRRRRLFFRPGATFALVRWASNDHGTVLSRLDILRAVDAGAPCQSVPTVLPGAEILLRANGWPKVAQVLRHLDAIDALGIDPTQVPDHHWRHVHNRLSAGEPARAYTLDLLRASILMRRFEA